MWDELKKLRVMAFKESLWHVVSSVTNTMAKIDRVKLSKVIIEQVDAAPADWQPNERIRAREYERDGKILAAQGAPFEEILERLRLFSSMNRFKLWVEGPKDLPAGSQLARKLTDGPGAVVFQSIGGWAQVLSENWSPRPLGDGCSDFIVLLDGDRARDWSKPGFPISPEPAVRRAIAKFRQFHVDFHILERYAIENYFPQSAFERVLGPSVASCFPLDPARSVEKQVPAYRKDLNGKLAEHTDLKDLAGTDLGRLLEDIRNRLQE